MELRKGRDGQRKESGRVGTGRGAREGGKGKSVGEERDGRGMVRLYAPHLFWNL